VPVHSGGARQFDDIARRSTCSREKDVNNVHVAHAALVGDRGIRCTFNNTTFVVVVGEVLVAGIKHFEGPIGSSLVA